MFRPKVTAEIVCAIQFRVNLKGFRRAFKPRSWCSESMVDEFPVDKNATDDRIMLVLCDFSKRKTRAHIHHLLYRRLRCVFPTRFWHRSLAPLSLQHSYLSGLSLPLHVSLSFCTPLVLWTAAGDAQSCWTNTPAGGWPGRRKSAEDRGKKQNKKKNSNRVMRWDHE